MIYLDSSAIVKLVRREPASEALIEWLAARPASPLVASTLIEVEVARGLRRCAPEALPGLQAVIARVYRVEVDIKVRLAAAAYEDPALRSLDAIHLATAEILAGQAGAQFEALVAYDGRLLKLARATGLPTASPGFSP